jgi:hypothetical protein
MDGMDRARLSSPKERTNAAERDETPVQYSKLSLSRTPGTNRIPSPFQSPGKVPRSNDVARRERERGGEQRGRRQRGERRGQTGGESSPDRHPNPNPNPNPDRHPNPSPSPPHAKSPVSTIPKPQDPRDSSSSCSSSKSYSKLPSQSKLSTKGSGRPQLCKTSPLSLSWETEETGSVRWTPSTWVGCGDM